MATPSHRPARARSQEEKQLRRADILRAAEHLWTRTPYADLSMNQVAREVQLAKGTLYLYFETREELFLALLESHYQRWAAHVTELLKGLSAPLTPDTTEVLSQSFADSKGLRRLQLLAGQVLSSTSDTEGLGVSITASGLQFRQQQLVTLQQVAALLPYSPATALSMVQHSEALCLGWQYLREKSPNEDLLEKYPQLTPLKMDTQAQLLLALRAVITDLAKEDKL